MAAVARADPALMTGSGAEQNANTAIWLSKGVCFMATTTKPAHPNDHPKFEPVGNAVKDPAEWTTGDEPMTGAQASYLKTLSEEAEDPGAYDETLTKAAASEAIDALRDKTGRGT
jgi:hypothetical protein